MTSDKDECGYVVTRRMTDEYPKTREQAVSFLAARGIEAHLSDWAGRSIAVVSHPDRTSTITVWKRSVHIRVVIS